MAYIKLPDGVAQGAGDLLRWRGANFNGRPLAKSNDMPVLRRKRDGKVFLWNKQAKIILPKVGLKHKDFVRNMIRSKNPTKKQLDYLESLAAKISKP